MRYHAVVLYIEKLIREKSLVSGSKLPSIRLLATELKCSKSTVKKAYDLFVVHKIAYVIDKNGYYLMNEPEKILLTDQACFDRVSLKPSLIDSHDIQQLFNNGMGHFILEQEDSHGLFDLRSRFKEYFKDRKIFTNVHDLIVVSSKQQALNMVMQLLGNEGSILVENPSDPESIAYFKRKNKVVMFNRLDTDLDLSLIEYHIIKDQVKLLFITSYMHLPKGSDLSLEGKMDLLDLCYKHGVYIIENNMFDDTYSYIVDQSLYALDKLDIVFHIKSFQTVFNPILNLCLVVSPRNYSNKLLRLKEVLYGDASYLEQMILCEFIGSEMMKNSYVALRHQLLSKFEILKHYCETSSFEYRFHFFENQMGCFIEVPSYFNIETLSLSLSKHNIIIKQCHHYFMEDQFYKGMIISLAQVNNKQLTEGIQVICDYIKKN